MTAWAGLISVRCRKVPAEPVKVPTGDPVELLHGHRRLTCVLGQRVIPVRAPCLVWQIPVVMRLKPGGSELVEQAGRAQRRRRQVLAGRIAGRAARHAHH